LRKLEFSEITTLPEENGGFRDPIEVAKEKLDWILDNHHPEPLEETKQAELKGILAAAEREFA